MSGRIDDLFQTLINDLGQDEETELELPKESDADDVVLISKSGPKKGSQKVGSEQRRIIDGNLQENGIDAIAFYKSRRFINRRPFIGLWGIFYLEHGISHIENQLKTYYPDGADLYQLSYSFIRSHEYCHYRQDIQLLFLELAKGEHLYRRSRQLFNGRRHEFVEEAIANQRALRWASKWNIQIQEFARDFMLLQPGAYARFGEPGNILRSEWMANVSGLSLTVQPCHWNTCHWTESLPRTLDRASLCPEYLVRNAEITNWLSPAHALPEVSIIHDSDEVSRRLSGKYRDLKRKWQKTKEKLLENNGIGGLAFKPWKKDTHVPNAYSVKVDQGNRAHLKPEGNGEWTTYIIGRHDELGHG